MAREYSALRPFVIMSSSYLLFTLTDGAIRMIVLLHAYRLGFSAWQVAIMFSLYELAGVATNLLAGLMGAAWGIKATLLTGTCATRRARVSGAPAATACAALSRPHRSVRACGYDSLAQHPCCAP
jgi:MFS family permease